MDLVLYNGAGSPHWCCDDLVLCDGAEHVRLDLRRLGFVSPLFLVRLRAWLDHHDTLGIPVEVLPPDSPDVQNYLSRMHLAEGLGEGVSLSLPTIRENPRGDRLIPLTRLDANGNSQFDELLGDLLASPDMRHAGYLAEVVSGTAQEMVLNAVDHGENSVGAYVAAQRFFHKGTPAPHRCVLAVGDLGIGMAAHLAAGGEGRASDWETIAHGMTDLVSGTGEQFRGHGYEVPFELARQKSAAWIDLRVRANAGWVLKRDALPPVRLTSVEECKGTWVEFEFAHASAPE